MLIEQLNTALPALHERLVQMPAVNYSDPLWTMLERLLVAHAPSGGANLLGAIGDDIAVLADELDLRDRAIPHLGSTGNTAIWLGADKPAADLVLVAHMDRPSFRVRALDTGALFPICANRFPPGDYHVPAKAVRFERGRLVVGAEGVLVSRKEDGEESLRFEARHGTLAWHDTVVMDVHPAFANDTVIGSGLDNSLGVLTALLTAAVLRGVESVMRERDRRCLFVFTDQEEGPPEAFFGHGAARLTHALPPPTYGCLVVDAHTAGPDLIPQPGSGVSHSAASGWGRGSLVPPNYHALAVDLAEAINGVRPDTVQMNTGYLSRSDDVALSRWARVLGLSGPPTTDPHTGRESARLADVQSGVWWLAHFVPVVLNLVPELTPRYALGR
jgi:putative aminopeptidase FrvX